MQCGPCSVRFINGLCDVKLTREALLYAIRYTRKLWPRDPATRNARSTSDHNATYRRHELALTVTSRYSRIQHTSSDECLFCHSVATREGSYYLGRTMLSQSAPRRHKKAPDL